MLGNTGFYAEIIAIFSLTNKCFTQSNLDFQFACL